MDKRREQGKKKLVEFGFGLTILRDSVALDSMCVDRGDSGGGITHPSPNATGDGQTPQVASESETTRGVTEVSRSPPVIRWKFQPNICASLARRGQRGGGSLRPQGAIDRLMCLRLTAREE